VSVDTWHKITHKKFKADLSANPSRGVACIPHMLGGKGLPVISDNTFADRWRWEHLPLRTGHTTSNGVRFVEVGANGQRIKSKLNLYKTRCYVMRVPSGNLYLIDNGYAHMLYLVEMTGGDA